MFDPVGAGLPDDRRYRVHRGNLFLLPATLAEFLALPADAYASPEDLLAGGWRID